MKPILVPHSQYQSSVLQQLQTARVFLIPKDWPLAVTFWMSDLSPVTTFLQETYSTRGPQPRDPASMLRSFLLFLMTCPQVGLTEWINVMKRTPVYAILSGFPLDDLPGVGTFYDFFARFWNGSAPNWRLRRQPKRKRKTTRGKKGEKAPTATPGRIKRLVDWFLRHPQKVHSLPADRLFDFFQAQFLSVSASTGISGIFRH